MLRCFIHSLGLLRGEHDNVNEANPALIFDTLNAFQRTGALKAAIELHLFTVLHQGPLEASAIAAKCNADVRGIRILCDYLTVIQFLDKSGNAYALTPTAAVFLDKNSPQYMGSVARFVAADEIMATFRDVAGAVRNGGTLLPKGGSTDLDFDLWVEFAKSMGPMMAPSAEFIAGLVAEKRPSGPLRVLDIAAGHGLFGITIAQRLATAEIVALDLEAVLDVANQNAEQAGIGDRYSLIPGDAMSVDFGEPFDCVLITNFLHHFDAGTCETFLKKVRACLKSGGFAMTLEFIPNEDRVSPETPAAFALTMLMSTSDGDAYTFAEYDRMFAAAGFQKSELIDVPRSPSRLVISSID